MGKRSLATAILALWSTAPFFVLLAAALLPDSNLDALGIHLAWPIRLAGLRLDRLRDPQLHDLWRSAARTLSLAASVAAAAASLAILAGHIVTRLNSSFVQKATEVSSLLAYALPTVFLLIAVGPLLPRGPAFAPLGKVALMHFLYILPLAILLGLGYCRVSPRSLDRAAAMDGARWPRRFVMALRAGLWRGWLAVFCVSVVISWSDLLFSSIFFGQRADKLIVDLYFLTYFDEARSSSEYSVAALFALVSLLIPALILSGLVAATEDR